MKTNTAIEPLEPRIAPAAITIVGKTATWTDFDGDIVTMKWTSADAPTFTSMVKGAGLLASRILLDPAKHAGASFTVTVKAGGVFGDGRVELGHFDGPGVNIKSLIAPKAGISEIDLGDNTGTAVSTLLTGTLGQTPYTSFTDSMGNSSSDIFGDVKLMKVKGDISYTILFLHGVDRHGALTITGSLRGDLAAAIPTAGSVIVSGSGSSIFVGGSILGVQLAQGSGGFKSVTIAGDVISDDNSPNELQVATEKLVIGGSVIGAKVTAGNFGAITKSIFIGGSLVARDGVQNSGVLELEQNVGTITIKGSLHGAEFADWKAVSTATAAGAIVTPVEPGDAISIGAIKIGGSIHAGTITNTDRAVNGGIAVSGNLGALTIGGSTLGYDNDAVFILARGIVPVLGESTAIGKVSIKGNATHTYIAAGSLIEFNVGDAPQFLVTSNPDAGIGPVNIGGDFVNSNLFAGVNDEGSLGVTLSDVLSTGNAAKTAKLGVVNIKGHLLSDRAASTFSGFTADTIASIVVNGRQIFKAGDGQRSFDDFIIAREL